MSVQLPFMKWKEGNWKRSFSTWYLESLFFLTSEPQPYIERIVVTFLRAKYLKFSWFITFKHKKLELGKEISIQFIKHTNLALILCLITSLLHEIQASNIKHIFWKKKCSLFIFLPFPLLKNEAFSKNIQMPGSKELSIPNQFSILSTESLTLLVTHARIISNSPEMLQTRVNLRFQ